MTLKPKLTAKEFKFSISSMNKYFEAFFNIIYV